MVGVHSGLVKCLVSTLVRDYHVCFDIEVTMCNFLGDGNFLNGLQQMNSNLSLSFANGACYLLKTCTQTDTPPTRIIDVLMFTVHRGYVHTALKHMSICSVSTSSCQGFSIRQKMLSFYS